MRALLATFLCAGLLVAACDDSTGPDDQVRLGILDWEELDPGDEPVLDLPDSADFGTLIEATVRTWAPDGCWEPAEWEPIYGTETSAVLVRPHDRRTGAGAACGDEPVRLERIVPLAFADTGYARIKVSGRRVHTGEDPDAAETRTAIEAWIFVRPQVESF